MAISLEAKSASMQRFKSQFASSEGMGVQQFTHPCCGKREFDRCHRRGFTIVELLIVGAVMAVLLSLILPAIQRSRAAARRINCQNHLRQIALASQQHASLWGHIPSNGWGSTWMGISNRGAGRHQSGSWVFNILPQCDQSVLHQQAPASTEFPPNEVKIRDFASRSLPVFVCSERRLANPGPADPTLTYFGGTVVLNQCAKSDYAINGGTNPVASAEGPVDLNSGDNNVYNWPNTSQLNGVSFLRAEIRFADLTDGSSQVILAGEKWFSGNDTASVGDNQPMYTGDSLDTRRWAIVAPARDGHKLGNELGFGSAHDGGAGFAFCDGSVRTIAYHVDPRIFQRLCERNDGAASGDTF